MSSVLHRNIATYQAVGAISKGQAVKLSTAKAVVVCSGVTDRAIGLAQTSVTSDDATAGVPVEVAMQGGGGYGLAKTTIAIGDLLGVNADGSLQKVDGANSIVIAQAMEAAAAADIFSCNVIGPFQATVAQS